MKKSLVLGLLLACVIGVWAGGSNPAAGDADAFLTTTTNRGNNGTTNGFDAVTASNVVATIATFTNLTVTGTATLPSITLPSASISTNTANFGMTFNTISLNKPITNGAFRAMVCGTCTVTGALAAAASIELWTWPTGGAGTNSLGFVKDPAGAVQGNSEQLIGVIQPNSIALFTNTSGAGTQATLGTNWISQW